MPGAAVSLNGVEYKIVPFEDGDLVKRETIDPFAPVQRADAQSQPKQLQHYDSVRWPNFSLGHGRSRIDSDVALEPDEFRRFWDCNGCITWHPNGVWLPILEEDATHTGLEVIRASEHFKGNLWSLWSDGSGTQAKARKFVGATTSFDSGATIVPAPSFEAETTNTGTNRASASFAHTMTSASGCLVVGIVTEDGIAGHVEAVTYDSVALTKRVEQLITSTDATYCSIWTLDNPATGSNTVAVTFDGTMDETIVSASGYANAEYVAVNSAAGTSTSPTVTVSGISSTDIVVDILGAESGSLTLTGAHTEIMDTESVGTDGGSQYKVTSGSSQAMGWTLSGSANWGVAAVALQTKSAQPLDLIAHKTHLIALLTTDDRQVAWRSTDGASWVEAGTQITSGLLANDVTANEDIDAGLLVSGENEVYAVLWDEDAGTITFFSSTNAGSTWTDEAVDIASGNGPQGAEMFTDTDGIDKLYVATREGVYRVDVTASTWTFELVYRMAPSSDNGRRMVAHQGELWFAQGVNNDNPPPMVAMRIDGETEIFDTTVGLDQGDGITTDAMGPVRWMKSSGKYLFASAGGGASSRNARIFINNGRGWHTIRRHGTANKKAEWIEVSSDDDGTLRLLYAVRTSSSVSDVNFLANPTANPDSGVSLKYEATGFIDVPYVDGGLPHHTKIWTRHSVNATDLSSSTSGQYINVDYGTGGAGALQARNNADLGDILSGTTQLEQGSGAGVGAVNLGQRINLLRDGTNTNTPILKDLDVEFAVVIPHLERYRFMVDTGATGKVLGLNTTTVLSNLESAIDLTTLAVFKYAGISTHVQMLSARAQDELSSPTVPGTETSARRKGLVEVICAELM
jgi:hypothetical protein